MKINKEGLDLIKEFEGLSLEAYRCPAGLWTIGYGHTNSVRNGQKIDINQANEYLLKDIIWAEQAVERLVGVSLTDNQFSALVSFVFNVGKKAFQISSMRKLLNQHQYSIAALEFPRWNKVGRKPLAGLTRRRKAEQELFLKE